MIIARGNGCSSSLRFSLMGSPFDEIAAICLPICNVVLVTGLLLLTCSKSVFRHLHAAALSNAMFEQTWDLICQTLWFSSSVIVDYFLMRRKKLLGYSDTYLWTIRAERQMAEIFRRVAVWFINSCVDFLKQRMGYLTSLKLHRARVSIQIGSWDEEKTLVDTF